MFWQWPVLAIQPATTCCGVVNPVAMFSPTFDHRKPTAEIRSQKLAPWVNSPIRTIVFDQPWAERSSCALSRSAGRWCFARSSLIRQTTARRMALAGAPTALVSAPAQTDPAWARAEWVAARAPAGVSARASVMASRAR